MPNQKIPNVVCTHRNPNNLAVRHNNLSKGDNSKLLNNWGNKKCIQKIVDSILYYARAVDTTVLLALTTITMSQAKPTKNTKTRCMQLLDYLAVHTDANNCFYASDMIMNIQLDASYLSKRKACSRARGHFFMGLKPVDGQQI
jgi:hypothetical protein